MQHLIATLQITQRIAIHVQQKLRRNKTGSSYSPNNETGKTKASSFKARILSVLSITMPRLIGMLYFASTLKFFVGLLGLTPFLISTG